MRSTRASAAVARLNRRSEGPQYVMALTGNGLFKLRERSEGVEKEICDALDQDEFVRFVNALGLQEIKRVTKNDAAFALQLIRKPKA